MKNQRVTTKKLFAGITLLAALSLVLPTLASSQDATLEAQQLIESLSLREGGEPLREHPRWQKPDYIVAMIPPTMSSYGDALIAALKPVAGDIEIKTFSPTSAKMPDFVQKAQVILGFCYKALLEQTPQLIWIQHGASGSEGCTSQSGVEPGDFTLTNIKRIAAVPIAEHAISLVLMLNKNLHQYHRNQLQKKWVRQLQGGIPTGELGGKTLLVLGLGGIGTEVAKRANALGMRVIATRNSSRHGPDYVAKVGLAHELYELAAEADFVVNALPLTPATTQLIDKKFFSAMKKGGLYISVGRGKTTVQEDLVAALQNGQVGGAGLDVTQPEPLPSDHPLWSMNNVVITPHVAGNSRASGQRRLILFSENLRRYLNGDRLLNVVDIARGY